MRLRIAMLSAYLLSLGVLYVAALTVPPLPLSERVKRADHIFLGTCEKMVVTDETGQAVVPEPKVLDHGQAIDMLVRVQEVFRPVGWTTNMPVTVRFGGGFFSVKDIREQFSNRQFIYIVSKRNSHFTPSYQWSFPEPLEKRADIEKALSSADEKTEH